MEIKESNKIPTNYLAMKETLNAWLPFTTMLVFFIVMLFMIKGISFDAGYYEGTYDLANEKEISNLEGYWEGHKDGVEEYKDIDTVIIMRGMTFNKPFRIPDQQMMNISSCLFIADNSGKPMLMVGDSLYKDYYINIPVPDTFDISDDYNLYKEN